MNALRDVSEDEVIPILPDEKLGICEACNANAAKYTCPRCEVKTCGLICLNLHKRELKCDGIRDRTKYIPLIKMTRVDLMNDYYFLEQCTKFVEDCKRDHKKRFIGCNKHLPVSLFRLRQAAADRGTTLKFMLQNFTRRQKNTTQLDSKNGNILWRLEWWFPNGTETLVLVDEKVNENCKLYDIFDKYLNPSPNNKTPSLTKLAYVQARGISGLKLLLKAEGIKQSHNRVLPVNLNDALRETLRNKTIVEYPIIYVVPTDQLEQFNVVDSDDDLEAETRQHIYYTNSSTHNPAIHTGLIEGRLNRMKIDQTKREQFNGKLSNDIPLHQNLLFSDDSALNQLSDSDEEGVLSEEDGAGTAKRQKT